MSDEIITAMSRAWGASIFLFESLKKPRKHLLSVSVTKLMWAPGKHGFSYDAYNALILTNTVYKRIELTRFAKRICVWSVMHHCIAESGQ